MHAQALQPKMDSSVDTMLRQKIRACKGTIKPHTKKGQRAREYYSGLVQNDVDLFLEMKFLPTFKFSENIHMGDAVTNTTAWRKEKMHFRLWSSAVIVESEAAGIDTVSVIQHVLDGKASGGVDSDEYTEKIDVPLPTNKTFHYVDESYQEEFKIKEFSEIDVKLFRRKKLRTGENVITFRGKEYLDRSDLVPITVKELLIKRVVDRSFIYGSDESVETVSFVNGRCEDLGSIRTTINKEQLKKLSQLDKRKKFSSEIPGLVKECIQRDQPCWFNEVYFGIKCTCELKSNYHKKISIIDGSSVRKGPPFKEKKTCKPEFNIRLLESMSTRLLNYLLSVSLRYHNAQEDHSVKSFLMVEDAGPQ